MIIDCFDGEFAFLSNFYENPSPIEDEFGIVYWTVHHYFQAMKSLDKEVRQQVASAQTPGKAKRIGRRLKLRDDWEDIKISVMRNALIKKFADPLMREKLLETGDAELVEGNTWNDTFWGVCNGEGRNELGRLLMMIRESYKGIE
jgi:ribA/ribD-fused uncharacterized protein